MRLLTGCVVAAAVFVPILPPTVCSSRSLPLRVNPRSPDDLVDGAVGFLRHSSTEIRPGTSSPFGRLP